MKVDPRFLTSEGPEIFTGNELLLKGALETAGGVHLLGGYPGSPIAGFFDSMALVKDLLDEKGIRAVIHNNEALACAALNGTQVVGCRGMIVIKSVGVHVAADALALGNLAGGHTDGGAVVVYGDDPWSDSTQVPADSRYISKHLFIPVVEPSDAQEIKDFVDLSFRLSAASELYVGYLLTNNLADGGGTVQCRANQYPAFNVRQQMGLDTNAIDLDKRVLLPPRTWWQEAKLPARHRTAAQVARRLGLNRILYPAERRKPLGFASSGLAYAYLVQTLNELGLLGEFPILKLGMSYPVDGELVRELAEQCERIIVVEERRGFLEEQIGEAVLQARQQGGVPEATEVWGKRFPGALEGMPETRGLHPSIITERLIPLFQAFGGSAAPGAQKVLQAAKGQIEATAKLEMPSLLARLATFCPGCPHRDSSDVCLEIKKRFMDAEYMRRVHGRGPADLVFHGDTGCYTMLMFPPNAPLMHDYSGMGLGAGTGAGVDPFITNKQVVFMGDSTFFHSGQIAISQAIKLGQDITFIILDNRTTAMTGHQPTPGVDYDVLGNSTPAQDIAEVVRGMAAASEQMSVLRVNPERRKEYRALLEKTFLADGVKVIIADKECGIMRLRRRRRQERAVIRSKGYLPSWEHMNINQELCRFCLACAELSGCPGLKHVDTDYGTKMDTDVTRCINDGACERIGACSAFEHVTVKRKRRPRSRVPELGLDEIPEPTKRPVGGGGQGDGVWRCCLAGVGGMGIGVATSILVRAGHKEGYPVVFFDKKGLAIRNGGVVSQVVYNISSQPVTALIPYGKADLLLGIDVLEAARVLDPAGRLRAVAPDRTAAVVNTDKINTSVSLMAQDDFDVAELEELIRANTRGDDFLARNISRICEKYLGSKLYANIMMLGFAFQKGLIPVSMHSMAWAIKDTIRADHRKNLYAFNMGRKLVVQPDLFRGPPQRTGWRDALEERCRWIIRRNGGGQRPAAKFRELGAETIGATDGLPEPLKRAIVVRLYDCNRWGGIKYARRYAQAVAGIYAKDSDEQGYAATAAVVHNLAGAMLIEDAVFIAELATSPEKYARDREKYNVNPANGDRISYRHLLHPTFKIGSREFTPAMPLQPWMLQVLKRSRYLRKLLPAWHRTERRFLADYERRVAEFAHASPEQYRDATAALSSPMCMNCMSPRCKEVDCPLGNEIPTWVRLAYQQRWREAAEAVHATNNFPEFTAQLCPAPCQDGCKQGIGGYPVQIRDLERQIVERAFAEGWVTPRPAEAKTGRKVAVVGSGPAGLAAAQQLARAGHDVTVFEKDDGPGGLLRYGIPGFRLRKDLIDRRLEQLTAEGVKFRTGVEVGADVPAGELRAEFDAVLLAVGAAVPRDLQVPGRNQSGVHFAMDFLRRQNRLEAGAASEADAVSASGKVVAVIGGGLTGEACVETAVMQGAKEVHQLEILPTSAVNGSIADRLPDGVDRQYCVATKAFEGAGGGVGELQAVKVKWTNSSNGTVMEEMPGTEFGLKVDLAVLAMGFDPAIAPALAEQLGLESDERGRISVTEHATSAEGVFAAGDFVTGASYIATAIDSGRRAAAKIEEHLARLPAPAAAAT